MTPRHYPLNSSLLPLDSKQSIYLLVCKKGFTDMHHNGFGFVYFSHHRRFFVFAVEGVVLFLVWPLVCFRLVGSGRFEILRK